MRNMYAFFLFFLSVATTGQAQKWRYGLKADLNFSEIKGNGMNNSFTSGVQAGGFLEMMLTSKFSLQPELLYAQCNSKKADNFLVYYNTNGNYFAETNIKLSYLNIPLMLKYNINKFFSVQAGPQAGFLLYDVESLREDGQASFKRFELSANAGIQFNISNVSLVGRYSSGLTNINNIDNRYDWKSRHIELGVAVRI